jgi:hypothetical protein
LVAHNHEVVAYGLREGGVEGVMIDATLKPYDNLDTVTLYMNSKRQKEFYDYILSLEPKRVIFNPGTENPEFYKLLEENNIDYEVACTLVLLSTNQY